MDYKKMIKILFLALILAIYDSNNNIDISEYEIKSSKIPNDFERFKILQLSDLHNKQFGTGNNSLIKKIKRISPDIIIMTGDMLTRNKNDYTIFLSLILKLSKNYTIYYIMGNHEQKIQLKDKTVYKLFNIMNNLGIIILNNETIKLVKGNSYINLYGLCINLKYYRYKNKETTYFELKDITNILGKLNKKVFNILLSHNPFYFDTYALWGADMTLSGHVHGGMIRLPFVGALFSPERKFFPKYSQGKYTIDKHYLIVNRGLGTGKIAFRLFNRPELSVITLFTEGDF